PGGTRFHRTVSRKSHDPSASAASRTDVSHLLRFSDLEVCLLDEVGDSRCCHFGTLSNPVWFRDSSTGDNQDEQNQSTRGCPGMLRSPDYFSRRPGPARATELESEY